MSEVKKVRLITRRSVLFALVYGSTSGLLASRDSQAEAFFEGMTTEAEVDDAPRPLRPHGRRDPPSLQPPSRREKREASRRWRRYRWLKKRRRHRRWHPYEKVEK